MGLVIMDSFVPVSGWPQEITLDPSHPPDVTRMANTGYDGSCKMLVYYLPM